MVMTWAVQSSGTNDSFHAVTWNGSKFVAVGWNGVILTSPDGVTWAMQNSGTNNYLLGVTWGESQFVAVGGSGTILRCDNDLCLSQSTTPPPAPIEGYLQFEEGNPGTEGDGIFIESSLLNFPYFSLTVDPKPVIGTNIDGTTITVFTELPSAQEFAQLFFEFGYLGTSCLVLVDDNDVVFSLKTTGEATYYSSAVLTSLTDSVRQLITTGGATITNPSGCSGASVSNMFLNRIEFLKFDLNPVSVDAVSIDPGIVRR